MSKTLVVYFSVSGETARLAKTLADVTNAELYEIKPEQKYISDDLNWNDKNSRSSMEMNDITSRPAIINIICNINSYDTIFVGFPIWWYEAPRIIQTFLESYDFSGKTIIPFATSGGSGMGKTDAILQKSCSASTNWRNGKCLSSNASKPSVASWVESLKL